KQTKKIAALVVAMVLIAAMGLALFLRDTEEAPDAPLPPDAPVIYSLIARTQAEITHIDIQHDDASFTLQRGAAFSDLFFWNLADEPDWQLDMLRVQEIIFAAFHLIAIDQIHADTSSINLAEFGLDPPRAVFTAHYESGATASIYLGNETPDQQHFFLMTEGDTAMYLVPHAVGMRMQMGIGDLLSRFIPPMQAEAGVITFFGITQRGREPLEMIATGNVFAPLAYTSPVSVADHEVSAFYLDRFLFDDLNTSLRVGELVALAPDDLTPFGLHDPFIELLYETQHEHIHLLFGDTFTRQIDGVGVPHIYVMFADRPHVFTAETSAVNLITDLNAMQFMTRFIALVPIVDVERVTITHPAGAFDMEINNAPDTNDITPTINGVAIPAPAFRVLYRMVIALAADASIDPRPATGTPEITITYHMLDGSQTVLDLFPFDANFHTFSLDGEEVWAVTNRRSTEQMLAEAARLIQEDF
ncbi:MAG: DUF4340 domain-containing protein, partial [Defluviitaleaceae bacterium]|nr:DUF4340 domain-containing protein [Defluviitaleaceae bacterium]